MTVQEQLKAAIAIMDEKGVQSHKTSDMALRISDWNELRETLYQCLQSTINIGSAAEVDLNREYKEIARWYKERHGEPKNG